MKWKHPVLWMITEDNLATFVTQALFPNIINDLAIAIPQRHSPQDPMKLPNAPPSPLPMLPFPTTQPHSHPFLPVVPCVPVIHHSLRPHQQGTHLRLLRHHKVHQQILTVPHRVHDPPRALHAGATHARVQVQVPSSQKHELCEHDGEPVRVDRVDPLPPVQIEVMGPREESHKPIRVFLPHAKREFQRLWVHLHVVVADQNGVGGDVARAREEAVVEAGGGLGEKWDGRGGRGYGEVASQLAKNTWRRGGVSPEDEHGGDNGGEGVGDSQRMEEGDARLRETVHQNGHFVTTEGLLILIPCGRAFLWVCGFWDRNQAK